MHSQHRVPENSESQPVWASDDARLVKRLRIGDPEAGHLFFREQYPSVYRYLLWLTGRPDQAEDLAQDTFVRAWQSLDRFDDRWPLRPWLHRIAYREFLHALRGRREEASLDEISEVGVSQTTPWTERVELLDVIRKLPVREASVVVLHYLEGYSSEEIARIVGLPAGTVRHRLSAARARLQQELGEDDLAYLNEPSAPMRQWGWLPLEAMTRLQTRLCMQGVGRRALGVGSQPAPSNAQCLTPNASSATSQEESMERREFLRQTAVGAAGLMLPEAEREVVDSRLTQKVTCAFKGTALADLCEKLKSDTGIPVTAGPSVADEKVTLFCEKLPLREVMRQLSRPFGYTWLRSGTAGHHRYELVQDLGSQLLEEELRNRDRNAALLALEQEIDRYRSCLDLLPGEALAKAQAASPAEKPFLERLAKYGWGPLQLYFRLSPPDLAALRGGVRITFSQEPKAGQRLLPVDVAQGVLQGLRNWRVVPMESGYGIAAVDGAPALVPDGLPPAAVPEVRVRVDLALRESELGEFALVGSPSLFTPNGVTPGFDAGGDAGEEIQGPLAVGTAAAVGGRQGPTALQPNNRTAHARLARDPRLLAVVTVQPRSACGARNERLDEEASSVTSADVLEMLHRATGMPVVADSYTRLYRAEAVSVTGEPLFDALDRLAGAMRLRWNKEDDWLQFRSVSFYDDRMKEAPNRLLTRWAGLRRRQGWLTLDEICEITALSDAQLDAASMAEGARDCWGLAEWDLARHPWLRPHLRFLASLSADQLREAQSATGLAFTKLTLAQQQQFISFALWPDDEPIQSLAELEGAALRVDYTQPGWFQWVAAKGNWPDWVTLLEPGPQGRRALRPPAREQTRSAALQAARRIDPRASEAQIQPTGRHLRVLYMPGVSNRRAIHLVGDDNNVYWRTW